MTQDEETVFMIRGSISELPETQQLEVKDFVAEIEQKIKANPILIMAVALVGAKLAV